jgi:5-methylcytosine-specific restriction protein B
MNYWHIQLHPNNRASFPAEKVKRILIEKEVIGMGEWEDGWSMINQFKIEAKIGDIVLVRSGGPLAIVQIVSDAYYEDITNSELDWFENRRKIKILGWFNNGYQELLGTRVVDGIFQPITFASAPNSEFIYNWYQLILNQNQMNELKYLIEQKHQIILQGPPGSGKTYTAKELAYNLVFNKQLSLNPEERRQQLDNLSKSDNFKLIQFHPAYSYEDFVRGIVAKANGNQVEYITENKTLAIFAEKAYKNLLDSQKDAEQLSKERQFDEQFEEFKQTIQDELDSDKLIYLSKKLRISKVDDDNDCFRIESDNWKGDNLHFSQIKKIFLYNISEKENLKQYPDIARTVYHRTSYYFPIVDRFQKFITGRNNSSKSEKVSLAKYVLIIDEINRANLPAVLGELIYALEYRGEPVNSMYAVAEDNMLILPPNLYIIGTMNTADRSVGHIDYAIRRRFAFVDVLPDESVITFPPALVFFNEIKGIFDEHTAGDFDTNDIMLGHSYFLAKDIQTLRIKLKYEVMPILKEYIKDGVLNKNDRIEDQLKELYIKIDSISE